MRGGNVEIMLSALIIFYAIILFILYHKIFNIVYFANMGWHLIFEFVACLFLGMCLAYVTVQFWFIAVPIVIIAIVILIRKKVK